MSDKNKKEEEKPGSIPNEIIDAISSLDPELLFRSESSPPCPIENFNISEMLDESKKKKEKEKEFKIGNYLIKRTLGQGTFGKVKLGIYLPSQEKVAIKILEKDRILEKDDEIRVKREFDMLALFNHPNVILVAEIFESSDSFYSVMEYCEGGELFNFIVKNRRLSEEEAAFFYYQLINGLEYIHSLGIVHRDLKPENLLLTKDHLLKIIDFGLSNYFKKGQKELLVTPCGSPCYASPEMVAGKKYDGFKIDIWSTGIILYAMLCGYLPFEDKDNDLLFEKILECKLVFPKYITKTSRDLIEKILVTDPDIRIGIPEIKNHPFFLKGKEIFEEEFSVCQIDKDGNESIDDNIDLNNILNIPILKDLDKDSEKENISINKEKDNKKEELELKEKEKENKVNVNNDKAKDEDKDEHEDKLQINGSEQENIIRRLNTELDEKNSTLGKAVLEDLEKDEKNIERPRNNSSMKKNTNRNHSIKTRNKKNNNIHNINNINNINKKDGPFKKRDIVFLKNNKNEEKNDFLKKDKKINKHDIKNNKKLVKTNNYNNIKKQLSKKRNVGNSVKVRNRNYKNKNKNLVSSRINYTNIIKNQFNSKENLRKKINKKENIYRNNMNNTIDDESLINKRNINFDFKLYNSSVKGGKKTRSVAKKNMKLTSFETTYNQKNKKYLDNLFNISSSIRKYEKKLNSGGLHGMKKNNNGIKINMLGKINNNSIDNNNNIITNFNRDKIKVPLINIANLNSGNINIIDNTKEEDTNNIIDNNNEHINIKTNLGKISQNKITPKNNNKVKKDKYTKRNINKLKHVRNPNVHNSNHDSSKVNYYLNEISRKKTLEDENKYNLISERKNSNHYNLKKMIIDDYKKKSNINKTEVLEKENTGMNSKKGLALDNNIITNNSVLNSIDNTLKTEPDKPTIKQKILKKDKAKINNNDKKQYLYKKTSTTNTNTNPNNRNQKNKISNYPRNLNKTTNSFNTNNSSLKNPFNQNHKNILDYLNTSANRNYAHKKNNQYRKKSQVITNNMHKKNPYVTIKNTVINFNIDTGIILASLDKKRKSKKNNSKRGAHNSVSRINNKRLYDLAVKYNNHFLTNETIAKINHSNTNENFPIKKSPINVNNTYNSISLNEDIDSNNHYDIIKRNSNYQKIYDYGDKGGEKRNIRTNNIKDNKNENRHLNKSVNNRDKWHMKYKSMKLEDFYKKGKKTDSKNIYINNNENSINTNSKIINGS